MALTKAEMEAHRAEYYSLISKSRGERDKSSYGEAVKLATLSFDFIDGMMQYERKYNDREFASVEAIEIVLKYAPFLFDFQSLEKLESLLRAKRRVEKNTSDNLADQLHEARQVMWEAHRFWDHLERHREWKQDELRTALGGDQDRWRWMAETWSAMGVIRRKAERGSYRLTFSTELETDALGKCPSCAATVKGTKRRLLERQVCPRCRIEVTFVLLQREPSQAKDSPTC